MRSKARILSRGGLILGGVLACASCGLLGQKDEMSKMLLFSQESMGCLNEAGPRIKAYSQGQIDAKTWGATWDCASDSLTVFKKFVRGGDPQGYTREDIRALVGKFLVTNAKVTPELVKAAFELKASVFGGSKEVLSYEEVDRVMAFIQVGKVESTRLLPHLGRRAREPSPDHLLDLADALVLAGENMAVSLNTKGNPLFSWSSAQVFADEIAKLTGLDLPPDAVAWLSAVKVLFTSGTPEGIEAEAWPRLLRAGVAYGGPAIAAFSIESKYLNGPNASGDFAMRLAWKIKNSLVQTFALYGGAFPLSALDRALDALPQKWIDMDKAVLKKALRPLARRMLRSRVPDAIDQFSLDLIFAKLDAWNRGQSHLEKIFDRLGAGPIGASTQDIVAEATRYAGTLDPAERKEVYRLILLARQTRPLFMNGDPQITFTPMQNHSLDNLSRFHWIRLAVEHLLQSYSSTPDKTRGTVEDLKVIMEDYGELARELKVVDPTVPNLHVKRFGEANLFTFASNGDKYMDADEGTFYVALLYSAATLSRRIREGTDAKCPAVGKDLLGYNWKPADCFRREFFGNFRVYADHFPQLVRFYEGLSSANKERFQVALESAARRYGFSEQNVASVDTDGFAGIMQYVEMIFARYDTNSSEVITLSEIMAAYPVFKLTLAEFGNLDPNNDTLLEGAFTYTVAKGHPPTTDPLGVAAFVLWLMGRDFWAVNANRLSLYKVLAALSVPEPLPRY